MSEPHHRVPANLEQQRKRAKDLLREAPALGGIRVGPPPSAGRRPAGVIDRLVAAGADIDAPGNGEPMSVLAMTEGNPDVQALRRHGARG